jgi:hypothetical protein
MREATGPAGWVKSAMPCAPMKIVFDEKFCQSDYADNTPQFPAGWRPS